eukprot:IDg18319t1
MYSPCCGMGVCTGGAKKAIFSDYHTCAFVTIRGGSLENSHVPTFARGTNIRNVKPGTCASTSSFIFECKGGPCKGNPVTEDVPGVFRNGKRPPAVLLKDYDKNAMASVPDSKLKTEPASMAQKGVMGGRMEEMRDQMMVKEEEMAKSNVSGKCANISSGPQKPTGTWGPKGSSLYRQQLKKFRIWLRYCRPKNICQCWD